MPIYQLEDRIPQIHPSSYVAPSADIIGSVSLGEEASVWFNAVVRGDNDPITIGNRSNIQDNSVLHSDPGIPLTIGDNVTVGHSVMLHGCDVGHNSLIGIGSIVLNRANIGSYCIVGANSLITEGKSFPDYSLIVGSPGRAIRQLNKEEIAMLESIAQSYVDKIPRYRGMSVIQ